MSMSRSRHHPDIMIAISTNNGIYFAPEAWVESLNAIVTNIGRKSFLSSHLFSSNNARESGGILTHSERSILLSSSQDHSARVFNSSRRSIGPGSPTRMLLGRLCRSRT